VSSVGDEPIDLGRIQAEINEEVRRRRAAGDFPPGLERELDGLFARYAPAASGDDFDEVLNSAETQSFVHADVPTESRLRPLVYAKRALRKLMAWYLRFVVQQVTAFAGAITRAVRLLGQRVTTLETVTVVAAERTLAEIRERRAGPDLTAFADLVVAELAGAERRVLHTECGAGELLLTLAGKGADVYGVEPVETLVTEASRAGLDARADGALAHLRAVPDASLGGLVLSGCVDALPLGEVLQLADRAAAVLAPGARLVLLSSGPAAWARRLDPVVADLAPGRPLHPETWCQLLEARGLTSVRVETVGGPVLDRVAPDTPGADVLNANTERLNRLLFEPSAYAVVATRP
jgi:hypothetical protein